MDTSAKSVVVTQAPAERETRKLRSLEEKLSIVAETMRPGASVAAIARRHGVNANLLFGWRRLHRKGLLAEQRHDSPPLLPVQLHLAHDHPDEPVGENVGAGFDIGRK